MLLLKKILIILFTGLLINGCKMDDPELHKAVRMRDNQKITELINKGVDINVKNSAGKTALMEAILFCNHPDYKEIVKFLIANGADVNIETERDVTALSIALMFGYEDIIDLLLDNNANPNKQMPGCGKKRTALMQVAMSKYPNAILSADVAESLIAHGADVNIKDSDNKTALDYAIYNNRKDIEAVLLRHGAQRGTVELGE